MSYDPHHHPRQPYYPPPSHPEYQQTQPYGVASRGYPSQFPLPPAPKKPSPWVWIVAVAGGVLGLCLFGAAANNLQADSPTAPVTGGGAEVAAEQAGPNGKAGPKAGPAKKPAGIGDAVRDGRFEFTVRDLDCSPTSVGNEFLHSEAQGRYCIVSLTVKNIGAEAQTFSGGNQKAYDVKGAEFAHDGGAELYANDSNETFLNDINPGNKVSGKVVFDVPQETVLTTVELHDSIWSGGVKVSLD